MVSIKLLVAGRGEVAMGLIPVLQCSNYRPYFHRGSFISFHVVYNYPMILDVSILLRSTLGVSDLYIYQHCFADAFQKHRHSSSLSVIRKWRYHILGL